MHTDAQASPKLSALRDPARLASLRATGLLDSPPEPAFDRLADLARRVLRCPVALVSLVDADRQFFKSCPGLPEPLATRRETPLSHSFCRHVVASGAPLAVADAREHPLVRDNPAVPDFGVIAYLGIPLRMPDGHAAGSFCVVDTQSRTWTENDIAILGALAESVMSEIALRRLTQEALRQTETELRQRNAELRAAIHEADAARRQAEQAASALREANAQLEKVLEVETVGVLFWDLATGRLANANDTFLKMMGYDRADIARGGLSWQKLTPPEFMAASLAEIGKFEASGRVGPYEKEYIRKDGSRQWLVFAGASLGGNACVEFCVDISARKQAEAELLSLNAMLEERVRSAVTERESALTRLAQAQKLTALGQLAGGVAHDFNNIAQAVAGGASMIERHAENPQKVRRVAGMIAESAARAASVTRRLLSLARRGELKPQTLELAPLLESLRDLLSHTLSPGLTLRVETTPDLPPVFVDKSQLETALVNLATNARDAMSGAAGAIAFAATHAPMPQGREAIGLPPGDHVLITVTDTGAGMDGATLERALEPFFTTKAHGQGTGLGLPMARGFAEQSGGALEIRSAPAAGTTVSLWLPVSTRPAARRPALVRKAPEGTRRVLLVDDEDAVREGLKDELSHAGFAVLDADGAGAALAALDAGAGVDLLVTDLSMPGMDGFALIRAARQRRGRLPAILLTGYAGEAATLAIDEGRAATCLLRKPISGAELAERAAILLATAETDLT